MKKIVFSIIFCLVLLHSNLSYSDNTSSITVQVKDTLSDMVTLTDSMYFLVYQDFSATPFKRIDAQITNPYTISGLLPGHHYRVEVYVHNIWSGVGYVDLKNSPASLDLTIPLTGGMRFNIFYNDGYTPIPNARVGIQSQDGKMWVNSVTDSKGSTTPYWLESTARDQDYYMAHITIAKSVSYTYQPIKLAPGILQDFKIVTPWPAVVSNLILASVYNGTKKVSTDDGKFFVEIYNETGLVGRSDVNRYGDADFSNLKVNEYIFKAYKTSSDPTNPPQLWGSKDMIINGSQNSISIYKEDKPNSTNPVSGISTQSCKCVAFRLDDIQDYYLRNQQEKVMDVFLEKNSSLTIGIIGNFFGKDKQLLDYLQTRVKNSTSQIEIANHGWNHENFANFSLANQSSLINQTNQKIMAIFGVKPDTFLVPLNDFNNDTLLAAKQNGITHISYANSQQDKPPYPLANATLYRFPETVYTTRLSDQGIFVGTTHDYVFQQVQKNMDKYGFAVVVMNPQDFSLVVNKTYTGDTDWSQIDELRTLIDEIKNSGLKIVTIDKINLDSRKDVTSTHEDDPSIPNWLKNTSRWWEKDMISDSEFINTIQYLVKEKIILLKPSSAHPISTNKDIVPWFKNNAGSWAAGQISKKEFANGINYLVTNGIIVS